MKTIQNILLSLLVLSPVWGATGITNEEFRAIADPDQRWKIIGQAPPEQKEQLKAIDMHLMLVHQYGGESELKAAKESYLAKAKGLGSLEDVFANQVVMWDSFISGVDSANEKLGMGRDERVKVELRLRGEEDVVRRRLAVVHPIIFHLAPSPRAIDLAKTAAKLNEKLQEKVGINGPSPFVPVTRDERIQLDRQVDEIFEQIKGLPSLTPAQAQKEYDDLPEANLYQRGFLG